MTNYIIQFRANDEEEVHIKDALEWRADRDDPDNTPHSFNPAEVLQALKDLCITHIKFEIRSELQDKNRHMTESTYVDGIS